MKEIHKQNNYIIYETDDGYLIQNSDMDNFAHTHIHNYETCLWIISLLENKKCPYDIPKYLLISLIRLTDDEIYLYKLNCILVKKNGKQKYHNKNANFSKNRCYCCR